jgi:hypothetical protein
LSGIPLPAIKTKRFTLNFGGNAYDYEEEHHEDHAEYRRTGRLHRHPVMNQSHTYSGGNITMKIMKNLVKSMQSVGEMRTVIGC